MKYTKDGALVAVASRGGQVYIHDAKDHYSLKTTTGECVPQKILSPRAKSSYSAV